MARRITRVSSKTGLKFLQPGANFDPSKLKVIPASIAKKLGVTPGSLYVPKDLKRVTRSTVFVSNRQYKQLRNIETLGEFLSLAKAARIRETNDLTYRSARTREQAAKTRATAERKRIKKRVEPLTEVHNHSPSREYASYALSGAVKEQFFEDREKKLRGIFIEDGRWHSMIDIAKEIGDPRLQQLMQSPSVKPDELPEAA